MCVYSTNCYQLSRSRDFLKTTIDCRVNPSRNVKYKLPIVCRCSRIHNYSYNVSRVLSIETPIQSQPIDNKNIHNATCICTY